MEMYKYHVFGLNVLSEMQLASDLVEFDHKDIEIRFGKIPEVSNSTFYNENFSGNSDEMIYHEKYVTQIYVKSGTLIIIEPYADVTHKMIFQYLSGLGMSLALIQRGLIPLHGSAIQYKNKCLLILGESGAGKSSLSTGLLDQGGLLITDDLVALEEDKNHIIALPSYKEQKVFQVLIETYDLQNMVKEEIILPDGGTGKYFVDRSEQFFNKPVTVDVVIMLRKTEDKLSIEEISGIKKMDILFKNNFNMPFVNLCDLEKKQFIQSSKLANQVDMFLISRPYGQATVPEQIALIDREISKSM